MRHGDEAMSVYARYGVLCVSYGCRGVHMLRVSELVFILLKRNICSATQPTAKSEFNKQDKIHRTGDRVETYHIHIAWSMNVLYTLRTILSTVFTYLKSKRWFYTRLKHVFMILLFNVVSNSRSSSNNNDDENSGNSLCVVLLWSIEQNIHNTWILFKYHLQKCE